MGKGTGFQNISKKDRRHRKSNLGGNEQLIDLTAHEALDIAEQVVSQRTSKKTKLIYASKITKWIAYFEKFYPEIIKSEIKENGEREVNINLSLLRKEHVSSFLGFEANGAVSILDPKVAVGTDAYEKSIEENTVYAYQTLSGHVSALKNAFNESKIEIPADINWTVDNFLDGYKKLLLS